MTVQELKEALKNAPDNAKISVGDNSGANNYYTLKVTGIYGLNNENEFTLSVTGLANAMENVSSLLNVD